MEDIQCKDLHRLASILAGEIGQSTSSGVYRCIKNDVEFILKMSVYERQDGSLTPAPEAEMRIMQRLKKDIIDAGCTPCVAEYLGGTQCKIPKLSCKEDDLEGESANYIRLYARMCSFNRLAKEGAIDNTLTFIAVEQCQVSLQTYINWLIDDAVTESIFRSFLFMLIFTLRTIEIKLPGTLHRDLHLNNIMVKILTDYSAPPEGVKYNTFTIKGVTWTVPFYGSYPKIIDWDRAKMPVEGIDSSKSQEVFTVANRAKNDFEVFLLRLYVGVDNSGLSRVKRMINQLNPLLHHRKKIVQDGYSPDFPALDELLRNELFADYLQIDMTQKNEKLIYKRYGVFD